MANVRASLLAVFATVALALACSSVVNGDTEPIFNGLPFTRSYSLAEIGDIPRGTRLSFDTLGRIAVINDGAVIVLNDATWMDIAEKSPPGEATLQYLRVIDGTTYYCGQGAWGTVEYTDEGKMRPHPVMPASCPKWISITNFTDIIPSDGGVYFSGWNGLVYWNRTTNEQVFFPIPQVSRTFTMRDKVFVSSLTDGIQCVDLEGKVLRPVIGQSLNGVVIENQAKLNDGRVLVTTAWRELLIFDGYQMVPWENQLGDRAKSRVSALIRLTDGGLAMAIEGQGVFIVSEEGKILTSLASPGYHLTTGLVTREAGVLWVATETGVEKVVYNSPVAVVDQRLGVPVTWPQLVHWQGRTIIASNGHIYESNPEFEGFQLVSNEPTNGVWGIAAKGEHMLVANAFGVFSRDQNGAFTSILPGINVDRLVMVNPELCFVIGATEIAALRWSDGRWAEFTPRIPGVGYPAVVHTAKKSAWIELGPSRAARVALKDGKLNARVFDNFPWTGAVWIHVSVVGNTVVLGGPPIGRVFFDEETENFVDDPHLQRLFREAPAWIARLIKDDTGTYWASYEQGVFKIQSEGEGYRFDRTTLEIIKDRVPIVRVLDGNDVWISSGYSLYHINRNPGFELKPTPIKPRLVSVLDGRSRHEVFREMRSTDAVPHLPFAQNSLTFRFFAGGYTPMRSPGYEFKMNGQSILGADSLLTLPDLREGAYHLEVRLADARGPLGEALAVDFVIDPPWYRTWYAKVFDVTAGVIAVIGFIAWALRRTRARNLALEKLVHKRTEELRTAMQRLEEETRNAATLAERDRLAGEIHDSLQQGLSGLILQLDATLKLPAVSDDVRTRLNVARNMVSFTRHEVQNAVWNLESPLLENADLGEALGKLAGLISSGGPQIELAITGEPRLLSSSVRHHLLRIAQEAITNAVRHGAAHHITVLLHYAADSVSLAVNDDGRGFVPQQVLTRELGHFGLRGLRGRADKINGDIKIVSEPGRGASIRIKVPTS